MSKKFVFNVLVVLLPALGILAFFAYGVTAVMVTNDGEAAEVEALVVNGDTIEHADTRSIEADGFGIIYFVPKTKGLLALGCTSARGRRVFKLIPIAPDGFTAIRATIDGCTRLIRHRSFGI